MIQSSHVFALKLLKVLSLLSVGSCFSSAPDVVLSWKVRRYEQYCFCSLWLTLSNVKADKGRQTGLPALFKGQF